MDNPTISIIVPVYNVEKYLDNCIKSILSQTFIDFELILVDDKSPDSSPKICDKFAKSDKRIKVIHKTQNEGLGFARNTGLDNAAGKYILFVDSDDYIEKDLLQKTLAACDENTEMVIFGFNRIHQNKDGKTIKTEKLMSENMSASTPIETANIFTELNRKSIFPFAWNKLYKRSFLKKYNAEFEKTKLIEDFLFNIYLFSKASYIKVISDTLYNYRKPAHETLVSAYVPEFFDLCKRKYTLEKQYLQNIGADTEENLQLIYCSYVKHLISVFIKNSSKKADLSLKEQKNKIKNILDDDLTKQVLRDYNPAGLIMQATVSVLKTRQTTLCLLLAHVIKFVKQ